MQEHAPIPVRPFLAPSSGVHNTAEFPRAEDRPHCGEHRVEVTAGVAAQVHHPALDRRRIDGPDRIVSGC
jgi:hypothetical protein